MHQVDGTVHDLDFDVRNELILDVAEVVERGGAIDVIFITGDVAFAGKEQDYQVARTWLEKLCLKTGCNEENVWVVPGNHDVDRSEIKPMVSYLHDRIQEASCEEIDSTISSLILNDSTAANVLASPMSEYKKFAEAYGCVPVEANLSWTSAIELDQGYFLKLVGINSALVSNPKDDETERQLVIGQAQLDVPRERGVLCASLCHHPMNWIKDSAKISSKLNARTSLQFYGHVHDQAVTVEGSSLIVQAGALQPDRREEPWYPSYNVLTLEVVDSGGEHELSVCVTPRIWSKKHCFAADTREDESEVRSFLLNIDPQISLAAATPEDEQESVEPESSNVPYLEAKIVTSTMRQLIYAFVRLPFPQQVQLAAQLGLLEESDAGVEGIELFKRIMTRADERGKVAELKAGLGG